jgi:hypothetical protein
MTNAWEFKWFKPDLNFMKCIHESRHYMVPDYYA